MNKTQIEFVTVPLSELKGFVEDACDRAVAKYKESISLNQQQVFNRKEAAVYLRFFSGDGKPNPNAIDRLRRLGKIKAVEDAGTVRYTLDALNEYLKKNASYEKGSLTLR